MERISLPPEERAFLERFVGTGTKKARTITRGRILLLLDDQFSYEEISEMTGIHRQSIWRIKSRYIEEGMEAALNEKPRTGQPRKYSEEQEAEIIAMACTTAPKGSRRWTVRLLTMRMRTRKGFETLNRETVRLILKKAGLVLGKNGCGASPR